MPFKSQGLVFLLLLSGLFSSCSYRFYHSDCHYPLPGNLQKQAVLDSTVNETSGLLYLDSTLITFNDSEGEAALYSMDASDGSLIRKTIIRNALNADWEDITSDESHIFVADVGNNYASRDTVSIYRIPKYAVIAGDPEVDFDGVITLSFADSVTRTRSGLSSHDSEALISWGDSLYLFTKDWVEASTSVYVLPKTPGHYSLFPAQRYEAGFQVCGADLFPDKRQVALVGYRKFVPVVLTYEFLDSPARINCGGRARMYPMRLWRQVEGICYDADGGLWISSEYNLKKQTLFRVERQAP